MNRNSTRLDEVLLDGALLDEVFAAAAAKTDPDARAGYLDQACADNPALRERIEALLVAHDGAGSFLKLPAGDATTSYVASLSERPGSTIGRYILLEQIGEGGFGVVFMAEQEQPVRRRVALKIIKAGMDTRQVVARFEAERQALAMMDHPHIAKVFDAGATDAGRPYFVMELVRGVPITEYCDGARLTANERLVLFQSVCAAVQHAHQKGIIHRDLKPSNVLVTLHDDKAVPKVIDFGVAKATQARLTERTLFTEFRQMVGTPTYMSPEQALMSGLDVDTRSDVYSLGVLLYELLTGSTPIDTKQLSSASYDDMRRLICEVEPQKPSARLSALNAEALTTLAASRHCEPAQLAVSLRSDLDWIVMKCLEKDRTRRYESASALALDLARYLGGQPVEARPPSSGYRFKKFVQRNRGVVVATALVVGTLLAGTVVATRQAIRATRAERVAVAAAAAESRQRELAEQRQREANDARAEAETQRAMAEANSEKARQAVDEYFTLVSENTLLNVPGLQPLRKELLDAALRYYEGLAAEDTNDPALLTDLAVGYMRVAVISHAVDRNDDAMAAIDRALEVIEQLRGRFPDAEREHRRLAGYWKGYRNLTVSTALPNEPAAAFQSISRLLEVTEALAAQYPDQVAFRGDLAAVNCLTGALLNSNGQIEESAVYFERARAISEQLVREQPNVPEHRADLARADEQFARTLSMLNRLSEAEAAYARALSLREQLVAEFPDSPPYRGDLGSSLITSSKLLIDRDPQQAKQVADRAVKLFDALLQEFPEVTLYRIDRSVAKKCLVLSILATNDPDQIKEGMNLLQEWIAEQPNDRGSRIELARMVRDVAGLAYARKEAQPLFDNVFRRTQDIFIEISDQHSDDPDFREAVGHFQRILGYNDLSNGRWNDARLHFEQAIDIFQWLVDSDIPQRDGLYREFLVDSCRVLVIALMRDGKIESAEAMLTEKLTTSIVNHPEHVHMLRPRAEARVQLGRWSDAADDLRKFLEFDPNDHWVHCLLASLLAQVGDPVAYHEHCAQMLRRFGKTGNPGVAHRLVKFSLILPWPEADFQALSDLADVALADEASPQEIPLFQLTKGLVEFRQGNFAPATQWMEKALDAPSLHYHHAQASMVLAMARHGLGEPEAARATFEQGSEYIRAHVPKLDAIGPNWVDSLIAHALHREAQAMLGLDAP